MEPYTVEFFKGWIKKCKECMEQYEKETDPTTLPTDSFKCQRISVARCFPCMFQELENLYDEEVPPETQHFWLGVTKKCINCMLDSIDEALPKAKKPQ